MGTVPPRDVAPDLTAGECHDEGNMNHPLENLGANEVQLTPADLNQLDVDSPESPCGVGV